jgi:putative chitinase
MNQLETKLINLWKGDDLRQLAYVLATVHHETAGTMLPIRERGNRGYFFRMYDPKSYVPSRASLAKRMGALPGDGEIFYGRGYAQLTWRANYEKFGKLLKMDFTSSVTAADKVLDPEISAKVLFLGMEHGLFTGKKLSDYFNDRTEDWFNARKIVNGLDRAQDIANLAKEYFRKLQEQTKMVTT